MNDKASVSKELNAKHAKVRFGFWFSQCHLLKPAHYSCHNIKNGGFTLDEKKALIGIIILQYRRTRWEYNLTFGKNAAVCVCHCHLSLLI